MARSRDPVANLMEQIEKLEKSLGKLDDQVVDSNTEFAKAEKELARATAQRDSMLARGVSPQMADHYSKIERAQKAYLKADRGQDANVGKYNETIDAIQKMRKEMVETTKEMEKERLRRNGAAAIVSGVGTAFSGVAGVVTGKQSVRQGVEQVGEGVGTAATGAVKMMTDLKAAGDLAAGTFMGFAGQISSFVQAFSPATVEQFNLAVRDLTAVVGVALQPVMDAFTVVVKEVSSRLYPVAQALAPVFATIGQIMVQVLTPALDTLASVIQALVPVFEVFAQIVQALTPLLRVGQTLIAGWVSLLTSIIESMMPSKDGVKGFMESFGEAMKELATGIMKVVAFIARALGATSFIDGMIKSLKGTMAEKKDATGLGAPTGAAFTNVSSFGQQVATRAFMATGGESKSKSTEEWLAKLADDLGEIKAGKGDLQTFLREQFDDLAKAIAEEIKKLFPDREKIYGGAAAATSAISASAGNPAALAGNLLGRYLFGG